MFNDNLYQTDWSHFIWIINSMRHRDIATIGLLTVSILPHCFSDVFHLILFRRTR